MIGVTEGWKQEASTFLQSALPFVAYLGIIYDKTISRKVLKMYFSQIFVPKFFIYLYELYETLYSLRTSKV